MDQPNGEPEQPEGVGPRAALGRGLGAALGATSLAALSGSAEGQTRQVGGGKYGEEIGKNWKPRPLQALRPLQESE